MDGTWSFDLLAAGGVGAEAVQAVRQSEWMDSGRKNRLGAPTDLQ